MQTLKDRQNLHEFLERKAEFAARGEKSAQTRLSEAEAEMEIGNWEKRNSDLALHEISRSLNSGDYSYNKRNNGLIRLKEIR